MTKNVKKLIAVLLVMTMMFSVVACGSDTSETTDNNAQSSTDDTTAQDNNSSETDDNTTSSNEEDALYTYHDYTAGSPKTWNAHEWETNDDSYIMNYTTMGFLGAQLNDTNDGYVFVPEMAAEMPVDVTADYAGNETFSVPADVTEGYAFKIALNPNATWEDGTPINADTYVYSYRELINPKMKNFRASSIYSGSFEIANAEEYAKQNQEIYTSIYDGSGYRDIADEDMVFSLTKEVAFFGNNTAKSYYTSGSADKFLDADGADLYEKYSENKYNKLTEEAKADLLTISKAFGDENEEAYKEFCFSFDGVSPEVDWSNVGVVKTGDYEITFVLEKPITVFNLNYSLTSNYIVKEDIYEANKAETGDLTKTKYGTSVENYSSYGPYKLTTYQVDKNIEMVKNDAWYGYTDGKHVGQYQTTGLSCQVVAQQATALQLFLQGKLDRINLAPTDMDKYRTSDFILYTPESYTTKITFNSDKAALAKRQSAGINKVILANQDFRKGFSLAIDREEFAAQCTATHQAGFGLYNYNYVADPDTGIAYRDTDVAKNVLCSLYGVEDEDQITGFDKSKAQELMLKAYNELLEADEIKADDTIELEFLVYSTDDTYVKMINYIQDSLNAALAGTDLEKRVVIKMTPDENYYDHSQEGKFEMIMSTWGGAAMNPYTIIDAYCEPAKLFEYGFTPKLTELTINVNGEDMTKTFYDWYIAVCDGEYAAADASTRMQILAGIEYGVLSQYCTTPIYYRMSTELESQRTHQGTDVYCQLVGFGGIRHITYDYSDKAWDEYCETQNYQLTY